MSVIYSIYSDTGKEQKTNHLGRSPPALEDTLPYRTPAAAPAEPSPGAGPGGLLQPLSLLGTGDTGTGPSSWQDQCKFPGAANSPGCHRDLFGCGICLSGSRTPVQARAEDGAACSSSPGPDAFCLLVAAKNLPLA